VLVLRLQGAHRLLPRPLGSLELGLHARALGLDAAEDTLPLGVGVDDAAELLLQRGVRLGDALELLLKGVMNLRGAVKLLRQRGLGVPCRLTVLLCGDQSPGDKNTTEANGGQQKAKDNDGRVHQVMLSAKLLLGTVSFKKGRISTSPHAA